MADYQSLVEQKLEPIGQSGNDTIYRCPKCEGNTGSGHFYVNYSKRVYHCFKCSFRGRNIESLLRYLQIDVNYDYERLYSEQEKELDSIISIDRKSRKSSEILEYSTNLDTVTSYYNLHTAPLSQVALRYLLDRGVSFDMIQRLDIREGISRYGEAFGELVGRDYSQRIMIPSLRRDGKISFYVGRDYTGEKVNKYMNPPKEISAASEDVWSLDIIEGPTVVICEGVMTAIAVNQALGKIVACATYGKSIAQKSSNLSNTRVSSQGEKLLNKGFKQYIIFYDKDARKEALDTAKYLHDRGANVRVVKILTDKYGPKADAADMTEEEIIEHIKNSEEFNIFSGLI